ncbi:MAG TPA: thiamine pyrophosphate-dependent dehydrogenase E1 component subunit alpha, partial [Geminicoccaceae bacterium]|nr:thiamine pyrophosphate-dependent dehydrogenase E1 component subunit alpha [Geminicoccaceae bacterium]
TGGVAIAFVGDGGSNQGTTLESFNLAKVWNLPAIFVIEDNGYAESTASKWSVAGDIVKRGEAYGIPSRAVDGHDFFEVYDCAREAIERARGGDGPSVIHCKLYRYYGHFEGDATTYRAPDEVERVRVQKDCLKLFRNRVTEAGLLDPEQLDEIDGEAKRLIDRAASKAKAAPPPGEADLLNDVYASYQ